MQGLVSQQVWRTCEGCGLKKVWETVEVSEETLTEMEAWGKLRRLIRVDGQPMELSADVCSPACAKTAFANMQAPVREDTPEIDIAKLRAGDTSIN